MKAVAKMRVYTQLHAIITSSHTVKNTFKEMAGTWDELKSEDGSCIITTDTASRKKYQLVQMYTRKLMKYVSSISGLDMFPMTLENPEVGNWRIDSIILQIASNEIKGHEHLFRLLMTNIFGVPTLMFNIIDKDFNSDDVIEMLHQTYTLGPFVGFHELPDFKMTVEWSQELLEAYIDGKVAEPFPGMMGLKITG